MGISSFLESKKLNCYLQKVFYTLAQFSFRISGFFPTCSRKQTKYGTAFEYTKLLYSLFQNVFKLQLKIFFSYNLLAQTFVEFQIQFMKDDTDLLILNIHSCFVQTCLPVYCLFTVWHFPLASLVVSAVLILL